MRQAPRRVAFPLLFALLLPAALQARTPDWSYALDGPGAGYDEASSIVTGSDGTLYVAGRSGQATVFGIQVAALDRAGRERWTYSNVGPEGWGGFAYAIARGADGNLCVAGDLYGLPGSPNSADMAMVGLTAEGAERWVYRHAGPGNDLDEAFAVACDADGNAYAAGWSTVSVNDNQFPLTVASVDAEGHERWVYTYDLFPYGQAHSITVGDDGNIYVAGYTSDPVVLPLQPRFTVISLNPSGTANWVYRLLATQGIAYSVTRGTDGNLYACGTTGVVPMFTVVSLNALAGIERWAYVRTPSGVNGQANRIAYGSNGNLYVAGFAARDSRDFTVVSLSSLGLERWVYDHDGPIGDSDEARAIVVGADGFIYAGGYVATRLIPDPPFFRSDLVVAALNDSGAEQWIYTAGTSAFDDRIDDMVYVPDGPVAAGMSDGGAPRRYDFTVLGFNGVVVGVPDGRDGGTQAGFASHATFLEDAIAIWFAEPAAEPMRVELYDLRGAAVITATYPERPSRLMVRDSRLKNLSAGVYFLKVGSRNAHHTGRIIKLR